MPRYARQLDFVNVFSEPPGGFGPWDELLTNRLCYTEHYSRRPSIEQIYGARLGLNWLTMGWHKDQRLQRNLARRKPVSGGNRQSLKEQTAMQSKLVMATTRPPIALVLANRVSPKMIEALGDMQQARTPVTEDGGGGELISGAWQTCNLDAAGMLIIDMSALPKEPGYSLIRWYPTPTNDDEAADRLNDLLGDSKIPIILRDTLHEAIMNQTIGTEREYLSASQIVRREGRVEAMRSSVRAVLQARGIEIDATTSVRIEECADLDTLARWLTNAVHAHSLSDVFEK